MLPIFLPKLVSLAAVACYLMLLLMKYASFLAEDSRSVVILIAALLSVPVMGSMGPRFRRWAREQARMHRHVEDFRISNAECFDESDRPRVNELIASLMRDLGHAPLQATDEDSLRALTQLFTETYRQLFRVELDAWEYHSSTS